MGSALKLLLAITKTSVWPRRLGEPKSESRDWCENSVGPVEQASNKQKGLQETKFKRLFSSDAFVTTNGNKVLFIYYLHLYYMYLRIPCELGLSWQTHWLPGEPIFGSFLLKGFWTNWPLRVHNCLVVNLSTYLFIYLFIYYLFNYRHSVYK